MDKADPTARAAQEQAKRNRRYLFAAIDAVTIGGMVGIGVFCRRAQVSGGRWTGIVGSSAFLELSKLVRGFFR
jgi:hypothetical protein